MCCLYSFFLSRDILLLRSFLMPIPCRGCFIPPKSGCAPFSLVFVTMTLSVKQS